MRTANLSLLTAALLSCSTIVYAQTQNQSSQNNQSQSQSQTSGTQLQQQNNGTTYQSSYQVNSSNGAGQGQGVGTNQAQADYNASSDIRNSTASPQGSYQEQRQTINGNEGTQTQRTGQRSRPGSVTPQ